MIAWLHLSDWHQKVRPDFDRKVILNRLIKDIRNRGEVDEDLEEIDFAVFTGDVAFSGHSDEYGLAKAEFFEPIMQASELNVDRLFMVPGTMILIVIFSVNSFRRRSKSHCLPTRACIVG
jgi:hypothetical protein